MSKTFHEILSEKDEEYTYRLHSTADIHDADRRERIRLEFMPFEIKSFENEAYKPLATMNTTFPNEPNSPTFTIKVVTKYPVTKGFLETVAWAARINIAHLKMDPGKTLDPVNKPEEVDSKDAQLLVGPKRIGEFIKELQDDRKSRAEKTWTREVYESFFITHRALEVATSKAAPNGYYMVEAYRVGPERYLKVEGPFASRPDGNPFYDRLKVKTAKVISEATKGGLYTAEILID